MKLASLNQGRDGVLVVVSRDLSRAVRVPQVAATLQAALDDWSALRPRLEAVYQRLNDGMEEGAFAFDQAACHSPLPRAYHWADGSAYVNHVELVRKARGAEMPESFWHDPLMYQGGADAFIPPHSPIRLADAAWGIDLEAELAVVTDDVPMGATPAEAAGHIRLLMLAEDLHVAPVITWWNKQNLWKDKKLPDSLLVPVGTERFYHLLAGEDERGGGALLYFNLPQPLEIQGAEREYPSSASYLIESRKFDRCHVDIEKPFWWDMPMWIASGMVDSIGLCNNHMQRSGMLANEAWGKPRDEKGRLD